MTGFEEVAAELYRLPPSTFTAQRNARAKDLRTDDAELSRRVAGLPKPALPAWALNTYAQGRPEQLADVLDLGAELREAQEQLSRDRLRDLTAQAHALVQTVVRDVSLVAEEAGNGLSNAAQAQVEQTLRAAMADAGASDAVRAGLLAKPLEPGGFGSVDLAGAVAGAPPHVPARRRPARAHEAENEDEDEGRTQAKERAVRDAEERERQAEAELREARSALDTAEADRRAADEEVERVRQELQRAGEAATATVRQVRAARQAHEKAERHLAAAHRRTEDARRGR